MLEQSDTTTDQLWGKGVGGVYKKCTIRDFAIPLAQPNTGHYFFQLSQKLFK